MARRPAKKRCHVFHFRADDDVAELIHQAKGKLSVSDFLREAAIWWADRLKEGKSARAR